MFLICKFSSNFLANLTSGVCRLISFLWRGLLELMRLTNGAYGAGNIKKKNGLKQRFRLFISEQVRFLVRRNLSEVAVPFVSRKRKNRLSASYQMELM
jgi:hypothetical protein